MTRLTRTVVTIVLMFFGVMAPAFAQTGNTIQYVYDELGRLIAVTDPAGDTVTYTYDEVGNLLSIGRYASSQVSIIAFSPGGAPVGTAVGISGTGFSATASQNTVLFNGVAASVTSATTTQLTVSVPSGATTGPIAVTSPAGSATSSSAFLVTTGGGVPVITSFSPAIGVAGTAVTLSGTNFQPVLAQNQVKFNIAYGPVQSVTGSTQLVSTIPPLATSGPITVLTPFGAGTSSTDLFIPPSPYTPTDVAFTARLTPGVTQVAAISTAAKIALLTFAADAGEQISVDLGTFPGSYDFTIRRPDGGILMTTTIASAQTFIDPILVTVAGTYTIVVDPHGTYVGSTAVTLYKPIDVTGTITPGGASVSVALGTPGQNAFLTFSGTAGQQVSASFGVPTTPILSCSWYLNILKPDGSVLASTSGCGTTVFLDTVTLPVAGTYTFAIDPGGSLTRTVDVSLYAASDVTGPIAANGTPVTVPLTTPGQNASLTFSGTAGQLVSASFGVPTTPILGCSWYLSILKPDGSVLATTSGCGTAVFLDTVTLPVTGTYTFAINPADMLTRTVSATLYTVTHVTGPIAADGTPVTVPLTTPGQNASLTFSGTAGQLVSASFGVPTTPILGCSWYLSILKLDGSVLATTSGCGTAVFLDTVTLPVTGTYTFAINPADVLTRTVSATLYTVTHVTGPITADGTPVTVPLTTPGQNASLTFSGTAGQKVSASVTPTAGSFGCFWYLTIRKPDGSVLATTWACGGTTLSLSTQTLPVTGTYTYVIDPEGTSTNTVSAVLNTVP